MAALLVVAGVALAAVVFFATFLGLLLKIAFRVIFFPLFLLKWIFASLAMIVVVPVLLFVGLVLTIVFGALTFAFGIVLSIPFLPLLALGAILWVLLVKANGRPAAA